MVMIFDLSEFSKFRNACVRDKYESWGESLRNNGFSSARLHDSDKWLYEMDEEEFILFALRWS